MQLQSHFQKLFVNDHKTTTKDEEQQSFYKLEPEQTSVRRSSLLHVFLLTIKVKYIHQDPYYSMTNKTNITHFFPAVGAMSRLSKYKMIK